MKLLLKKTFESFQIEAYSLWENVGQEEIMESLKWSDPPVPWYCVSLASWPCFMEQVCDLITYIKSSRRQSKSGQGKIKRVPWVMFHPAPSVILRLSWPRPSSVAGICAAAASSFRERLRLALYCLLGFSNCTLFAKIVWMLLSRWVKLKLVAYISFPRSLIPLKLKSVKSLGKQCHLRHWCSLWGIKAET